MGNCDIAEDEWISRQVRRVSTCSCNVGMLPAHPYRLLDPCRSLGGFQKLFNPWKMPHAKVNAL